MRDDVEQVLDQLRLEPCDAVEFRILGPLEIRDGERVVPLGGPKRRAVVAALLLHPNRVVGAEQLVDLVWGEDPPASAAGSLQNHVMRLRRELADRIVTRAPGYLARIEPGELDLDRFRDLVEEARGSKPAAAVELLGRALALWRGKPLADLVGEPVGAAAAHLAELRLDALERRVEAELELGRHAELVPELEALVAEQPFRERLRAQLVLALYRSGRQADALAAYAEARETLVEQLGSEPGPELRELQRAILRQDEELAAPRAAEAPSGTRVEEARKTVTILLAELAASATSDPEARRDLVGSLREQASAVVAAHGGESGRTGDRRVLGIFGVPAAREDDALRAVRAACELRAEGLVLRTGVATGDVITGDPRQGTPLVSGVPLEEADGLLEAAANGDVLIGRRTWRLVRHAIDGAPRQGAHAVERVLDDAVPVVRALATALVGREAELDDVVATFRRAVRDGRPHLVTIFGSPGVGKTRLAQEAARRLDSEATCLVGRTPDSGTAPTYAPLRDALASLAGRSVGAWAHTVLTEERDGEAIAGTIAAAVGEAPSVRPVEETAWATRRLLETLARQRPLLLILEDLHWASPTLLDLVEHVAELVRAPILLLALARPELLDTRPEWAGGNLSASSILLQPLPADDAAALLDGLAARTQFDDERRRTILDLAAGNPLFLEQLVAAALEGEEAVIPDSIHALLAARLDRLAPPERELVEAAAACGQSFATGLLEAIVRQDPRPTLRALARRDLVQPEAPGAFGEETWGFRHVLVRDEAYAGIPKRRRAHLHRQIAAIVAEQASTAGIDADPVIGYHLESAYRALVEVEAERSKLVALAEEASARLESAGRRALNELDFRSAVDLLRRASELLPASSPRRLALALPYANALATIRDSAAVEVVDEAAAAVRADDAVTKARLLIARDTVALWGPEERDPDDALPEVLAAIEVLEGANDEEGLAYGYLVAYLVSDRRPRTDLDADETLGRAAAHARAAGARSLEGAALAWLCILGRRGSLPVETVRERVLAILADPPSRDTHASALGTLGTLRAMEGASDEARELLAESHAALSELAIPHVVASDLIAVADIELIAGDLASAEPILRECLARLEELGARFSETNAAWRLALVLVQTGRDDEAEELLERTADVEAGEFVDIWRHALSATIAAHRGQGERAALSLKAADERMDGLDEIGLLADALIQLAEADTLIGRTPAAEKHLEHAARIAHALGYSVCERRARERLEALRATAP